MTNSTLFNTPILTPSLVSDNQLAGSGVPNVVLFTLLLNGAPLSGQSISVSAPPGVIATTNLITDQNGQCYSNITSSNAGGFPCVAYMTQQPTVSVEFITTFRSPFPIELKNSFIHFAAREYPINSFLSGILFTQNHRYRVTLSRPFTSNVCNAGNVNIVASLNAAGNIQCNNTLPYGFQELSEDGLYFRALYSRSSAAIFGRFKYRPSAAGLTQVIVKDMGPSPDFRSEYASYPALMGAASFDGVTQNDEDDCPDCHM